MERRFEIRKAQLLAACEVKDELFEGVLGDLRQFVMPFAQSMLRSETRAHVREYVEGLLSDAESKNAEAIAYLHGMDRQAIQHFVGSANWDERPLIEELARQVGKEIGEADGVIVFDPSAHEKRGEDSVGVAPQYSGRHAKVTNCQMGIYMAYASRQEHAVVDERLFLPKEWARDRKRRKKCGVPEEIRYRRRQDLALEMLRTTGKLLPHGWVTGDDEMGHPSRFRRALSRMHERYLMAVPSNVTIRDLEGRSPKGRGQCGRKKVRAFEQVRKWVTHRPAGDWTELTVRNGEKGPVTVQCLKRRVRAKNERRTPGPVELLFVMRSPVDGGWKNDFFLGNADKDTPLEELARVAKAEHRVEECLERSKGEVGLSDYEVRTWRGWHHHHALCFLAVWFLTLRTIRGKKADAGDDRPADQGAVRVPAA